MVLGLSMMSPMAAPFGHRAPGATATPAGVAPPAPTVPAIKIILPQPTWINVTPAGPGPSASEGGSSAYDPESNETVLFGGCLDTSCNEASNATWVFARGVWTNITNYQSAPPARDYAAMDYDANMHGVLLFGGQNASGVILDDTWLFTNGTWTDVSSYSAAPPARYGAAMAFDPQPEENGSVLFGGYSNVLGYLNDTWIWEGGAGWVELKSSSLAPPGVVYTSMAYDPTQGYIVQTGGYEYAIYGDDPYTWELYSGQWWNVTPASSPPGRSFASMVFDPSVGGVVLFGGYSYDKGVDNDQTWVFAAGAWIGKDPSTSPPGTNSGALALDGTGSVPILFGGNNASVGVDWNSTWAYEFGPYVASFTSGTASAEVDENASFTADIADGTAPYELRFAFGDGAYAEASGVGPDFTVAHTYTANGSYTVTVNVTDAVGATYATSLSPFAVAKAPSISASASPTVGDVGAAFSFTSSVVSKGAGSLSYLWSFGDKSTATTANATHAYGAAGTYTVSVVATDADRATSTVTFPVTVVSDPTVSAASGPSAPVHGSETSFYANVSGGVGPYSYTWIFGDKLRSSLPDPQHVYNASGTYDVLVYVNDSGGGSTHASLTVHVGSPSSSSASLSGAPTWFWGGIGALAAAAVVGSVLLVRRGRMPKA